MLPIVDWMTHTDRVVLQWLHEADDVPAATPKTIHLSLSEFEGSAPAYSTITTRVRKLDRADLVEKHPDADSHYRLTQLGEQCVLGEIGADDLPDPDGS